MGWFPSLICKNYIFKYFMKTLEILYDAITYNFAFVNFSNAHAQTFALINGNSFYLLPKAETLVVVTLDCLLPEANRLFKG